MELEEGMYLRFNGMINKILELDEEDYMVFDQNFYDSWDDEVSGMYIKAFLKEYENDIRVSHKIIDLVEIGDYVNGYEVAHIFENNRKLEPSTMVYCKLDKSWIGFYNEDIKSIVTKQQMESMSYKVE